MSRAAALIEFNSLPPLRRSGGKTTLANVTLSIKTTRSFVISAEIC